MKTADTTDFQGPSQQLSGAGKRSYERPVVSDLGNVRTLTMGTGGSSLDVAMTPKMGT